MAVKVRYNPPSEPRRDVLCGCGATLSYMNEDLSDYGHVVCPLCQRKVSAERWDAYAHVQAEREKERTACEWAP